MKRGLLHAVPGEAELMRLYYELSLHGAPAVGKKVSWSYKYSCLEELFALAGEMLRYDARLLTILLQLWIKRWLDIHPLRLRAHMHLMRYPQALLVMLEFARLATHGSECRYLLNYLRAGWEKVEPPETFFLDGPKPHSRMAQRISGRNLAPYARWGFLGTERPLVDLSIKRTLGHYDKAARLRILDKTLERNGSVSIPEYLEAVDYSISRQQARTDLRGVKKLRLRGQGRASRWMRTR